MSPAVLAQLLLGDGRFPAGGHAHSGGVESAVRDGRIADESDLEAYLVGRLQTSGLTEAALASATAHRLAKGGGASDVLMVDAEAEARMPVAALRQASRRLGRQLLRAAERCWPSTLLLSVAEVLPDGPHQPVALGVVGIAAGLAPPDVATLAVHHAIATPAQAAVRLLGLDPFAVTALSARLAEEAGAIASRANSVGTGPLPDLPAATGPTCEIAAAAHAGLQDRLFVT